MSWLVQFLADERSLIGLDNSTSAKLTAEHLAEADSSSQNDLDLEVKEISIDDILQNPLQPRRFLRVCFTGISRFHKG